MANILKQLLDKSEGSMELFTSYAKAYGFDDRTINAFIHDTEVIASGNEEEITKIGIPF